MDLGQSFGTKKLQRETIKILFDNLNNKIGNLQEEWNAEDDDFFNAIDQSNPGCEVDLVPEQNFRVGSIPSLINASIDNYPNVCAIAYRATPQGSSDDVGEEYTVTLTIELMVKSLVSEEEINTKIQNMIEAVHMVMLDNRTINNTVSEIRPPRVTIGDVFVRRENGAHGDKWFWQGASLEYDVSKYMSLV